MGLRRGRKFLEPQLGAHITSIGSILRALIQRSTSNIYLYRLNHKPIKPASSSERNGTCLLAGCTNPLTFVAGGGGRSNCHTPARLRFCVSAPLFWMSYLVPDSGENLRTVVKAGVSQWCVSSWVWTCVFFFALSSS